MDVYELRQYTLVPGQRDVLIELFDRQLVEPQEALGMTVAGQFTDLDRPDHFVWLRGFPDMVRRREALAAFYGGPVWAAHKDAANATMIDSDDVLLLRPVVPFPVAPIRPPVGATTVPSTLVAVTVYALPGPVSPEVLRLVGAVAGGERIALLQTEPAPNTFPALPVREGEHVVVRVARYEDEAAHRPPDTPRELLDQLTAPPVELRLRPTARSRLR